MMRKPKALFLSHGGGPLPLLGDSGHLEMVSCLRTITENTTKPDALLVVSAHWEESVPTITAAPTPPLIYDYYGFPEESYRIQYPCRGEPELAKEVARLLGHAEIPSRLDPDRGFDHGVFVPLKIMYPEAEIPCVQLSLVHTLDPSQHIDVGSALRSLTDQNVLIIGSGFSFHNLRAFFSPTSNESQSRNQSFETWLTETCCSTEYSEQERRDLLVHWSDAPGARYCHPREEHLLPLHLCYGVGNGAAVERIGLTIMNKSSSMYLW